MQVQLKQDMIPEDQRWETLRNADQVKMKGFKFKMTKISFTMTAMIDC